MTSFTLSGLEAVRVGVEVSITPGLPKFSVVGLTSSVVKESKERVVESIRACKKKIPSGCITINLSPADLFKRGSQFDLPIALGILIASMQIDCRWDLSTTLIAGQLSLQGDILGVHGIFAAIFLCKEQNIQRFLYPRVNCDENILNHNTQCMEVKHLSQVMDLLLQDPEVNQVPQRVLIRKQPTFSRKSELDFADVFGNQLAKRVIQISLLARLNFLFIGPPGCGKTMLIMRGKSLLSNLSNADAVEVTKIHMSHPSFNKKQIIEQSPFRVVHNSCSEVSLLGGGSYIPYPGEISLAHRGVLFLDELCEFSKRTIQMLRVPLEQKHIRISRSKFSYVFPCDFILMSATNPCPCGYYGDLQRLCVCTPSCVQKYFSRISGPFLDRIHMILTIVRPKQEDLFKKSLLSTSVLQEQLQQSRDRLRKQPGYFSEKNVLQMINSVPFIQKNICNAHNKGILSLRRMNAVVKVAMADALLENVAFSEEHVLRAIQMCRIPYQQ